MITTMSLSLVRRSLTKVNRAPPLAGGILATIHPFSTKSTRKSAKKSSPPPPSSSPPPYRPSLKDPFPSWTPPLTIDSSTPKARVTQLAKDLPHYDVVRYHHKNRVWSLQQVEYYSDCLAIGLAEAGTIPGDVVLSWLPAHFSETMVLQFACAKTGLILFWLDPAGAVANSPTVYQDAKDRAVADGLGPEQVMDAGETAVQVAAHEAAAIAQEQLASALSISKANFLVQQEAGDDVNYIRLTKRVIPETQLFDYQTGDHFVTPRFPHLRYCIHTGYDQDDKEGFMRLRHFLVPSANLDTYVSPDLITAQTPLAGFFATNEKGVPTGIEKVLTNQQVVEQNIWPTFNKILNKEYHEVEGVGVVN